MYHVSCVYAGNVIHFLYAGIECRNDFMAMRADCPCWILISLYSYAVRRFVCDLKNAENRRFLRLRPERFPLPFDRIVFWQKVR